MNGRDEHDERNDAAAAATPSELAGLPSRPGPASVMVKLERFEGPLDLLLHLIKRDEIDIYDIPIAHITQQYLNPIELSAVRSRWRASSGHGRHADGSRPRCCFRCPPWARRRTKAIRAKS
jgi:hypothetical protein